MLSVLDYSFTYRQIVAASLVLLGALLLLTFCLRYFAQRRQCEFQERDLQLLQSKIEELQNELETTRESLQQSRQEAEHQWQLVTEYRVKKDHLENRLQELSVQLENMQRDWDGLTSKNSRLQSDLTQIRTAAEKDQFHHKERLAYMEQSREQLKQEFQVLAGKILETNTSKLSAHSENQLKQVLTPISEQLKTFQKKVEDVYDKEAQQRFSLVSEITKLQELNKRISADAIALTNALKGENKIAGNWGEVVLQRLLELSGLTKDREYVVQSNHVNEAGNRLQPDVLIRLPDEKVVIIDSKVSLVAYESMYNAESEADQAAALRDFGLSLRQHVKSLSRKNYQEIPGVNSLDFVLLFVPIESAFATAIEHEANIFTEAYQQNIVIVSPSTLLATLKIIHNLWRHEYLTRNAQEIAHQAGSLYDKFANFGQDLLDVGQRLNQTQSAYQQAMERLSSGRGNLLSRVEKLKTLGARTSKTLPPALQQAEEETIDIESEQS